MNHFIHKKKYYNRYYLVNLYKLIISVLSLCINFTTLNCNSPKLTVIIIIDQFSPIYLKKLKPFLSGGIQFLVNNGVHYTNAFFPHCKPETAPGHTMISTGTYATYHGIINNKWYDKNGKKVECDDDNTGKAAVFKGEYAIGKPGKSAHNILVDGISDQLKMYSFPHAKFSVWSLSLKSRSAICTAGKLGKAIWFDSDTGYFTSSKAYFEQLPHWLVEFNKQQKIFDLDTYIWKPFFRDKKPYYFDYVDSYKLLRNSFSILDKTLKINQNIKERFDQFYLSTPNANYKLIELAKKCIENNLNSSKEQKLVLWLCLSSLDKLGHNFGQHSKETIDLVYHIDNQIGNFINYVYSKVNKKDVLFLLTADHGVAPVPEIVKDMGLDIAHRYDSNKLIQSMNKLVKDKYGIKNIIQNINGPQFYLNEKVLNKFPKNTKDLIISDLKNYLISIPGIRKVWTYQELETTNFNKDDIDIYLKRQLYKGRSGQLIYSTSPYTIINNHKKNATHCSQYVYDTHVPLIIYQFGKFENKKIHKNVYMTQIAPTLAQILNVPRPSAAVAEILPKLKI